MGKPDKKLKKILCVLGITGAVYGIFRFLLPLVVPFLLAWALALLLRPSSSWLARHSRISVNIKGKKRVVAIPVGVIGIGELLVMLTLLCIIIYCCGYMLIQEAGMFLNQIPAWIEELDVWLTGMCHQIEDCLCLNPNCLVVLMREMLRGLADSMKQAAMPYLMVNSVTVFRIGMKIMVVSVILLVSAGLVLQEMDMWKRRIQYSIFCEEYTRIGRCLAITANAYLKTQGIIMLLTSGICTGGFWLLGNPYYILAGISIGILDALPIFGTGTVLVPWAVFCFFQRRWGRGLLLLALYLVCYFLREILEAKMMGNRVGLSSLETLVSMYVGLQLFGVAGFLLGPIGLLLVKEMVSLYDPPVERHEE